MVRIYFKLDPSKHKFNDSDIDLESKVFSLDHIEQFRMLLLTDNVGKCEWIL